MPKAKAGIVAVASVIALTFTNGNTAYSQECALTEQGSLKKASSLWQ